MTETWCLTYDRQTSAVTQSGLEPVLGGFNTNDDTVHITLQEPLKIKRSRFSYTPVFIYIGVQWVMMARHYLVLLSALKKAAVPLEVDAGYAVDYLRYQCPWTYATFCKQIQIVRNAEEISIPRNETEVRRFSPFLVEQNAAPDIGNYLSNELKQLEFGKTVFHISSGLDSSLLVLLASSLSSPKEIMAVSCETMGRGASDEIEIVKKLAADVGFHLNVYDFKNVDVFVAGRELIQQCMGYPIAHPSHLIEYLLDKASSASFDVIVSGRGPDECLGGYVWHQQDYRNKEKYLARMRVTGHSVMRNLFREDFSLPQDEFKFQLENVYGAELSLHDRLAIDQRVIAEAWGIVHSGIELGLSVHIAKPFQNAKLAEGLFNLDEIQMINGSTQKAYLRETMSPYYVDYLLNAPKRGLRLDLKPYLEKANAFLDEILDSKFAYQYLNKSEVIRMYSSTIKGADNYGWQLWSLIMLVNASALIYN